MQNEWEEPCSAKEAFSRRRILLADIQNIEAQLGNRLRRSIAMHSGRRKREAYYRWRTSACVALTNRLEELRYIKEWIFEHEVHEEEDAISQHS